FNPREAKLITARDEAAIKKRGLLTEEHPISTKDGLRLFLTRRMTVLDEAGEPQYLIKTHEDVTDRRQTESRMAHMAYHDGLTDLPNRAAFLQALTQMIEACEGTGEEFAVLCVDLDGLKEVNDVFGHAHGDKLLVEVAQRLQDSARGGVPARRCSAPSRNRAARSACSSRRWTSRSAIAASCTRTSRWRSRMASSRSPSSRRGLRATASPRAISSASRRWHAGSTRCAARSPRPNSFRSRRKAA